MNELLAKLLGYGENESIRLKKIHHGDTETQSSERFLTTDITKNTDEEKRKGNTNIH